MKIFKTSLALGITVSEGICASAEAQAMWHKSALRSSKSALISGLGRERVTGLLVQQPALVPTVDDVPTNDNYTNAPSAHHHVRRLLPTP